MALKRYFFLILTAIGCRSVPFHPETYSGRYLLIGEGGGFAGVETTWYFTERGQIYRQTLGDTTLVPQGTMEKKVIDQVWESVEQLNLNQFRYHQPGNSYKFIAIPQGKELNRIVWSSSDTKVHPACVNIHKILKQNISQNE